MTEKDGPSSEYRTESVSRPGETPTAGVFACSGEYWTIGYGGKTFPLKDVKGLSYIQRLLRHPGEEFHALDLLGSASGDPSIASANVKHEDALPVGVTIRPGLTGDAGEMLDAQAKREYRSRLRELSEALEDQRERGNHERADQIESEMEFLSREFERATGRGGRDRRSGSNAERARLNVTRAIRAALEKISEQHAALGELLNRSVRTGSFCTYVPDPRHPVSWRFAAAEEAAAPAAPAHAEPLILRRAASSVREFTEGTAFVGRDAERATLLRLLEQARSGEGKIVLIGGPAGVGKTRIAAEIGAQASRTGFLTYAGACYDRDDSVPFIPFVEVLEAALAQATSIDAFRQALGDDAAELARLLPQLRRTFPEIPPPLELPPEQSRRILFDGFAKLIARVARSTPVLILLDDLHWADEGSLSLLNYLAQLVPQLPVLVVCTFRDFELRPDRTLAKSVDELNRLHLVERITLGGLPEREVAQMLRALSGREPPQAVVNLFYSDTEGNPFFVEELFLHLVEQGKLIDSAGEFRRDLKLADVDVPQSLRLLIGRRLARLKDPTQKTLATAAVIGRAFAFELLEAATGGDADSLLDCVEEAEKSGLISSTVQYPDARFQFAHELIRQTVVAGLSAPRRQRLHLDVADAIERLHANALEDQANDLAHHLWQAGAAADPERTVRYIAIAAKRAREQGALTETEGHCRQALTLLETMPQTPARDRQELEMRLALGQVLIATRGYASVETATAYDRASTLG
ncbi:MAG: ATP-binding protein, partial [Candidatus Binataceae bacterium]